MDTTDMEDRACPPASQNIPPEQAAPASLRREAAYSILERLTEPCEPTPPSLVKQGREALHKM